MTYVYTEEEKDEYVAGINGNRKVNLQRYKGLGEMNPEQLWETTMDPEKRNLLSVVMEDGQNREEARKTFSDLMGADVAPRKRWIQANARNVKELDV